MESTSILDQSSFDKFLQSFESHINSLENEATLDEKEFHVLSTILDVRLELQKQISTEYDRKVMNMIMDFGLEFEGVEIPTLEQMKGKIEESKSEFEQSKESLKKSYADGKELNSELKKFAQESDLLKCEVKELKEESEMQQAAMMAKISKVYFKNRNDGLVACE